MNYRTLSVSEVDSRQTCSLQHDLRYVGHSLGGVVLKSRYQHYNLRRGRAWGIGVQVWHTTGDIASAHTLMLESIEQDAEEQRANGVYTPEAAIEHAEMYELLKACLSHYAHTMPLLRLAEPEKKLLVKIPGLRGWQLDMRLDGVVDAEYGLYPFESKFRNQLSSHEMIEKSRQPRWYAAGWREETHQIPAGFIVDERLAKAPEPDSPVKINKGGEISKVQSCTPGLYLATCTLLGEEPDAEVLERAQRRHDPATYHRRVVIRFTHRELDEALEQMRSEAHAIRLHERGVLTPIRNPNPQRCPGCAYRDICTEPTRPMAEAFFDFAPPKRFRGTEAATT